MSMETVRVTPGIFPPTISTTPNSPRVCAKLSTAAAITPGIESGRIISRKVRQPPAPAPRGRGAGFVAPAVPCRQHGRSATKKTRPHKTNKKKKKKKKNGGGG